MSKTPGSPPVTETKPDDKCIPYCKPKFIEMDVEINPKLNIYLQPVEICIINYSKCKPHQKPPCECDDDKSDKSDKESENGDDKSDKESENGDDKSDKESENGDDKSDKPDDKPDDKSDDKPDKPGKPDKKK